MGDLADYIGSIIGATKDTRSLEFGRAGIDSDPKRHVVAPNIPVIDLRTSSPDPASQLP